MFRSSVCYRECFSGAAAPDGGGRHVEGVNVPTGADLTSARRGRGRRDPSLALGLTMAFPRQRVSGINASLMTHV